MKNNFFDNSVSTDLYKDKLSSYDCSHSTTMCTVHGGQCNTILDGYTVQTVVCATIGIIWIFIFRDTVAKLQSLPFRDWMIIGRDKKIDFETEVLKRVD